MKLPSTQFQGSDRGVRDRKSAGAELIFSLDTRARHSTSALLSAVPLSQISKYARVEAESHASLFEQSLTLLLIKVQPIQSRAVARTVWRNLANGGEVVEVQRLRVDVIVGTQPSRNDLTTGNITKVTHVVVSDYRYRIARARKFFQTGDVLHKIGRASCRES